MRRLDWSQSSVVLGCVSIIFGYLAAKLGGSLILRSLMVWPLWPGNAFLATLLLLAPRRRWPIILTAGFAGFALYDLEIGVTVRSILLLILADLIEILTAAFGISYSFDGVPRLNSLKSLAKYSVFGVILAPISVTFVGAIALQGNYWTSWRISFFSEALAFLTVTPAILSWFNDGSAWLGRSRAKHLEGAALFAGLVLLSYFTFVALGRHSPPVLLYSLVPFLLWAALRFGSLGISTSVIIVSFLSIWGAVHGRGPFAADDPLGGVLSLQLFLVFTSAPFMVLGCLAEERKLADRELRESEERLRLAVEAGKMYAFDWDLTTDVIVRSGQCADVFNWMEDPTRDTGPQFISRIHPEDRGFYANPDASLNPTNPAYQVNFRLVRPDASVVWLEARGRGLFDNQGRTSRIRGMAANVTARKETEEALNRRDAQLAEAQHIAKLGSWRWDLASDTLTWSEELYRICGLDERLPAPAFKEHPQLFTPESWERLRNALERALHDGTPYELDLELVRPDGTTRWLHGRGKAQRDSTGHIVQLYGTVQDIAERKEAEEAIRHMSGRLITAHEEERSRIARELHDDLSQQMALLQVGLEQFEQGETAPYSEAREKVHSLKEVVERVSSNIHDLSHRLHPSRLDILGLLPSLASFCREFSKVHHVQVQFAYRDVPEKTPRNVTLCLFRIAQEALRNVVKHSGSAEAKVELLGLGNRIELCVLDTGVGFDPESAATAQGIGLLSMRERLRLIGGDLIIESASPHGTRIRARAPLAATDVPSQQQAFKAGA